MEAVATADLTTDGLEQRHLELKGRIQTLDVVVLHENA